MKKLILVATISLLLPVLVFAQTATTTNGCTGTSDLGHCVGQIYIWSLAVAALLALVMIVMGGYLTLTARGNAEQASKGRSFITSSLIGLVLLFGAYLLLQTINPDLTQFNFTVPPINPSATSQTGTGR